MHRKVCSIGNSRGVSIPSEILGKLELAVGSEVDEKIVEKESRIIIEPVRNKIPEGHRLRIRLAGKRCYRKI